MEEYLSLVVKFSELNEEGQKRIIKDTLDSNILMKGAFSEFAEVRLLVLKNENTTIEIVKLMMKTEKNEEVIKEILNSGIFATIKSQDKKEFLEKNINSQNQKIRCLIASYQETPKELLTKRLEEETNLEVVKDILRNTSFHNNWENDLEIKYKVMKGAMNSANKDIRLYMATYILAPVYMLLEHIKIEQDKDVVNAILLNKKIINAPKEDRDEALKVAINSNIEEVREVVAKYEFTPVELLLERLKIEEKNSIVGEIIRTPQFIKLTEDVRDRALNQCLNSQISEARSMIAIYELTKGELLAERLKKEQDGYVVNAILENSNFKNLDESIRNESIAIASKAEMWNVRAFIARYELTPKYILEDMLSVEKDEDVIKEIRKNRNFDDN